MKLINLGLPKSGTTTLAEALTAAGLRVADHRIRRGQTADAGLWRGFVGQVLYRGYYGNGDPLRDFHEFDAVTEASFLHGGRSAWPQMDFALIEAIRARHPQVIFIATRRDPAAHAGSMRRWTNMGARLARASLPGLPADIGSSEAELTRWIEGHHARLRAQFAGDPRFAELDVSLPDAQSFLSGLTGLHLPWWGQANANPNANPGSNPSSGP